MQAERSQPTAAGYDTFTCLRCDLVLSYRRPGPRDGEERDEQAK
jgi:hypothetical protein